MMMTKVTERLADLASGVLLNTAYVTDIDQISPRFARVEMQAQPFRAAKWTPGAKLQVRPQRGTLALRTYTPISWDGERGTTQLIVFTHGEGPAASWFRRVAVGDECEVFGPRGSVDLHGLSGPVVFVGDESSVGLACALQTVTREVRHVFEATDPAELSAVLTGLGFGDTVAVVPRGDDRELLIEEACHAAEESVGSFDLVLSGDAASVHALRRDARL
jgi:ferric-chelate reductase (NADPH)